MKRDTALATVICCPLCFPGLRTLLFVFFVLHFHSSLSHPSSHFPHCVAIPFTQSTGSFPPPPTSPLPLLFLKTARGSVIVILRDTFKSILDSARGQDTLTVTQLPVQHCVEALTRMVFGRVKLHNFKGPPKNRNLQGLP